MRKRAETNSDGIRNLQGFPSHPELYLEVGRRRRRIAVIMKIGTVYERREAHEPIRSGGRRSEQEDWLLVTTSVYRKLYSADGGQLPVLKEHWL